MSEPLSGVERRADRAREFRLSPLDRVRVVLNLSVGDQWPDRSLTATTSRPARSNHEAQQMPWGVERHDRHLRLAGDRWKTLRRPVRSLGVGTRAWSADGGQVARIGDRLSALTIPKSERAAIVGTSSSTIRVCRSSRHDLGVATRAADSRS
jgi:hypothetical protein